MKKGIDISYHQGGIDFVSVKKDGIDFVIIREGYRMTTDVRFFEYVAAARSAGLTILGVYHFSYGLNEEQAKEEAKICIQNMKKAGLGPEVLVFFDFEYDTVTKAAQAGVTLTRSECNNHTIAFCEEVKRAGYIPGVYTNLDYYKNWYSKDVLNQYLIWLADYTDGPDFKCLIQQYTSKGKVSGINGNVDMNYFYNEEFKMGEDSEKYSRSKVVELITSWIGMNEIDGSYKEIVDIYNSQSKFPRGIKMIYGWAWCACTWSALGIKLGYTKIMPVEISCGELIKISKEMGCWEENDGYIPSPADGVLYDWDDNGVGDNTGWPDHIGVVTYVNQEAGYMEVTEGNYNGSVKKRTISLNGRYIRGFITPRYDDSAVIPTGDIVKKDNNVLAHEVIAGKWGSGVARKIALTAAGYNYTDVQTLVNQILNGSAATTKDPIQDQSQPISKKVIATCAARKFDKEIAGTYTVTANLYCRNDSGTNKKALCVIPSGTKVKCYGNYNEANGVKWPYIQFTIDSVQYTGFSSGRYLKKE